MTAEETFAATGGDRKGIAILGSTGSIGLQTLDVVARYPDRFKVTALTTNTNVSLLMKQASEFQAELVAVMDETVSIPPGLVPPGTSVVRGLEGILEAASLPGADIVVNGLSGSVGLKPTLKALETGRRLALANKESLVMAGGLVTSLADETGAELIPVDSEHSAIFQCLCSDRSKVGQVRKIILTASGGPFREWSRQQLQKASKEEALAHPTWEMGQKITVDSATLMNKGLEVIEAHWLFGLEPEQIEVLIHPQSIVHSMVEFSDGSILAQLSLPDMRLPIQAALFYPERAPAAFTRTEMNRVGELTFKKPDYERFPSLGLAYQALESGGTAPVVLNAANEVAVEAFLDDRISFVAIASIVADTLERHEVIGGPDLDTILAVDAWAREKARSLVNSRTK